MKSKKYESFKKSTIILNILTFSSSFLDSEQRSKNSYEDDYQYDGEREDSDTESVDPPSSAR